LRLLLPEASEARAPEAPILPTEPVRGARVLLIDDEANVGQAMKRALNQHGHEVTVETRGWQAVERIALGERFDLVLCDLMMPEVTGMEVLEHLERLAPQQAQRLAFLSGGAFSPRARTFVDEVRYPVLLKPCGVEQVLALIGQVQQTGTTLAPAASPAPAS
jgi:CheY-like chemotaxis protein